MGTAGHQPAWQPQPEAGAGHPSTVAPSEWPLRHALGFMSFGYKDTANLPSYQNKTNPPSLGPCGLPNHSDHHLLWGGHGH